jgi:hypothetical protein
LSGPDREKEGKDKRKHPTPEIYFVKTGGSSFWEAARLLKKRKSRERL